MRTISAIFIATTSSIVPQAAKAQWVQEFDNELEQLRHPPGDGGCASTSPDELRTFTSRACSSCLRHGYNMVQGEDLCDSDPWPTFHFSRAYLQKLRDGALWHATETLPMNSINGMNMAQMLWSHVQMIMWHPTTKHYNAQNDLLTGPQIKVNGTHTFDPQKVNWTALAEIVVPHGSTQGAAGLFFINTARLMKKYNLPSNAAVRAQEIAYYLKVGENLFNAYNKRIADGGVRSNKTANICHNGKYCYWFHSGGRNGVNESILNKHLLAVRDALDAYLELRDWSDAELTILRGNLFDWVRGGLLQLAYGPTATIGDGGPPSLYNFMEETTFGNHPKFYSAYYDYAASHREIGDERKCHYHYFSLDLLRQILTKVKDTEALWADPNLQDAYWRIVDGRESRTAQNPCTAPHAYIGSHPVPAFYVMGTSWNYVYAWYPMCTEAEDFHDNAGGVRDWFDSIYADCHFRPSEL